jgi:hypothetical protein
VLRLRSGDDRAHVAGWHRLAAAAALPLLAAASFAASAEWSAFAEYERFRWREPSVGVTEKGPLVGLGAAWTQDKASGLVFRYHGKYYFGDVKYTGGTLVGNQPVETIVEYDGLLNELQATYRGTASRLQTVVGVGLDYWNRQLSDVQREEWWVYYARVGAEWGDRQSEGWFVGGGLKYPFHVLVNPHARSIGFDQNTRLYPEGALSLYADLGYRFASRWTLSAFFDTYRFNESPAERVTGPTCLAAQGSNDCGLLQPASNARVYGLRVYFHF